MIKIQSMQTKGVLWLSCLFLCFIRPAYAEKAATPVKDQLIVFVQSGPSVVNKNFIERELPKIRDLAEQMNVSFHIVDANNGAPAEVTITPLIVFQNEKGRSIYQGRTNTIDRIRNFIRTSRFVPQKETIDKRKEIILMKNGRSKIWAKIKISPVSGTVPGNYDHNLFEAAMRKFIMGNFSHFKKRKNITIGRSDRGFYMDFYPWLSGDGTLFLSLALYSQFHCKKPIYEQKKNPLTGPWGNRGNLFKKAAAIMEDAVHKAVQSPKGGDGFDVVNGSIPVKSWKNIGFPLLKEKKKLFRASDDNAIIPKNWILLSKGPEDAPVIQFRFPAPLDQYTGEATRVKAQVRFPEDMEKGQPKGFVEVDMTSVTMGEPDLDDALQGSIFLETEKYPFARFDLKSVDGDRRSFGYGKLATGTITGQFYLKGVTVPMTLPMEMEPILDERGKPQLWLRGTFHINLSRHDIEGADGPEPERNTLVIDVNLLMVQEQ